MFLVDSEGVEQENQHFFCLTLTVLLTDLKQAEFIRAADCKPLELQQTG